MTETTSKESIGSALRAFSTNDFSRNSLALFSTLGYKTERCAPLSQKTFEYFKSLIESSGKTLDDSKFYADEWKYVDFLFQLTKDDLSNQVGLFDNRRIDNTIVESYLFLAVELSSSEYSRTALARITRQVNRVFSMPVMILFKYGDYLTLSVIDRRISKKDESRDVLEKVTLIKDISIEKPHRAHIEILHDLSLGKLREKFSVTNFVELHRAWLKILDTKELNRRFYSELSNWYFWAMNKVEYPDDIEKDSETRNSVNLIRLLTRIIFVWFIKEKRLIPEEIFFTNSVNKLLREFLESEESCSYYKAILQNLFFAVLNQKMGERAFAKNGSFHENKTHYGVKSLLRYSELFKIEESEVLELFKEVPFLNGGLFDCLDVTDEGGKVHYVDGFSRKKSKQPFVPDYLFFSEEKSVDLNEVYGTTSKIYKVKGLLDILSSYKFTIAENTPVEEEVALDPELLGRVFENLLASYNPETQSTARKQTGSFYTPREIVNYMVDESLNYYLKQNLEEAGMSSEDAEVGLDFLIGYNEKGNPFNNDETQSLIKAIDNCKILDPACGSGAFPMGILHKLVHILHKLDPDNAQWKERQIRKAEKIEDPVMREQAIEDIENAFLTNELDYGRKLFLIENCIHGVDIQPIAVQISKLRFFISLVVDQKKDPQKENMGILSLPNLETKFVAANTLIELDKPQQMKLKDPEITELEDQLTRVRHMHFGVKTRRDKLKYQEEDKRIRERIAELLEKDGWNRTSAKQISVFDPYDQNASSPFFDPEWMFGVNNNFDIVIGNPPYMRIQGIQQTQPQYVDYYKRNYRAASGSFDLYALFIERGYNLANPTGWLSYIVPHKFFQAAFGKALREILTRKKALRQIVRFGAAQVFDEVTTYTCLLFLGKIPSDEFDLVEIKSQDDISLALQNIRSRTKDSGYHVERRPAPELDDNKTVWNFSVGKSANIVARLLEQRRTIGDITRKIFQGLATSADKIYVLETRLVNSEKLVVYSRHLDRQIEIEAGLTKPFLMGKDVHRYEPANPKSVVIFPYLLENKKTSLMSQEYLKNRFPLGWKYLKENEEALGERENGKMKGQMFYSFSRPQNLLEFEVPKIMTPEISLGCNMTIDEMGEFYHTTKVYSFAFKPEVDLPLGYLLGLLNSKILWFFLSSTGYILRGGYFTFKTNYLKPFPIPESTKLQETLISTLVDYVLFLKSQGKPESESQEANRNVMTSYFERIVDLLVYELYFPEEFGKELPVPSELINSEGLQDIEKMREGKLAMITDLFNCIYNPNHEIRKMVYHVGKIETLREIEKKREL